MISTIRIDLIIFNSQGFAAEQISKWVQDRADVQVREKSLVN